MGWWDRDGHRDRDGVLKSAPNLPSLCQGGGCWKCQGGVVHASPPTVLQWHHPRIILLSKGVFPAPRGVQEPWWYPKVRDPCPAFAAMSLGISPLLKNEHLIKRKKKTQEKEKTKLRSQPKALSQGNTIRNSGAAASLAGFPVGRQVGGVKPGWGAVTPILNAPHHALSPLGPTVATPKPPPPWELKGDLCLPLNALLYSIGKRS